MSDGGYRLVRGLARLLLALFYRRVEVIGLEHVPASGPLIVAANHQNALVDPMLLLATIPRQLRPLAKAPLFRHPLIGPFLRLAGALPVHRRQDSGSDPAQNTAMFRAVAATLNAGGAILIFPEGVSQPEPALMPLRSGVARVLLDAETASGGALGVTLLPVGLVFHEPGTFRAGWALALVGDPVPTRDCLDLARVAPEAAVRQLRSRLAETLRGLMIEVEDQRTFRLLRVVERIWREESAEPGGDAATRTAWLQGSARAYRYLMSRDPARVERLRREVERYAADLEMGGLAGRELARTYPPGVVWRYALREGLSLLVGLPLALWGIANHAIPYQLTALAARVARPSFDTEATFKLVAGLVLYPLCWIGEGWLAWRLGGASWLTVFLVSLGPTAFFALTWRVRLDRVRRDTRGFLGFLRDRDLFRRLLARRRALMEELRALARLVPAAVLVGEPDADSEPVTPKGPG